MVKCMSCGLVQLAHDYNLAALYGDTYGYRSGLNQSMVRHLQCRVREIEERVRLEPGDLVLDIGSNDGTLLGAYSVPNVRRVGIDPCGGKFRGYYPRGVELIDDFFSAPAVRRLVGSQNAKVISSIAMFYDLEDPMRFVEDILRVLGDDGIWVFEQSYLPSMLATCSYDTVCHEHLEYYTLKQVVYFARRLGLKILDVDINEINGGSFCVTASRSGSRFAEAEDLVGRILADEKAAGLHTTQPFECLQRRMRKHRHNLLGWGMHLTPDGPISCGLPLPQPAREGNHPAEVVGPTPEAHCASWRHGGG